MRRVISLICAIALTAAGLVMCYFEFLRYHAGNLVNGAIVAAGLFMLSVGVAWLWSDFSQWND